MALTEEQKRKIEEEEKYRLEIVADKSRDTGIKHGLPALLSFFISGLGQLVKGRVGKGMLVFFGVCIGLAVFVIPGVILWIWQIMDAYND